MANKHSDIINRSILWDDDVKKIEETLGKPIRAFSFDEIWNAYAKRHKLQETVSVSSTAVAAKVMADILDGARFFGERWRQLVNIRQMDTEQEKVPVSTEADYRVYKGSGAPPKESGGQVVTVDLDVSKESKDRNMWVSFRQRDVDRKAFNIVSDGLRKAGSKFNKSILDEIITFAIANAGTTQALGGTDRFTTTSTLVAKMEDAGFPAEAAAMTPTDFAKVLQTQMGTAGPLPFISNMLLDRNGQAIRQLQFGEDYMLLGYVPGVKVPNSTDLGTNLIVIAKNSIQFGLYQDLTIVDWVDPQKSLKGFKITASYDIQTHSKLTAGIGKGTGY